MSEFICLYEGPGDECRNCGGWTRAGGGPSESDRKFCSEDCLADFQERSRQAAQRAAWCPECGYDRGEHGPGCQEREVVS